MVVEAPIIYFGNLPYYWSEEVLEGWIRARFPNLTILMVNLMTDDAGKSRGFAFLEIPKRQAGYAPLIIEAMTGGKFLGRTIKVALSKPRKRRKPRSFNKEAFARKFKPKESRHATNIFAGHPPF